MGDHSGIQWTDATWNPTTGCTRVSAGCDHCYAFSLHDQRYQAYLDGRFPDAPAQYHRPFSEVQLLPQRLTLPLRWTKPRRIFVDSMADLFHADVPEWFIASVMAVMAAAPHHTFQILTKRPQRMRNLMSDPDALFHHLPDAVFMEVMEATWKRTGKRGDPATLPGPWPLPNVWLGTSVEDQAAAYRIDWLVKTPAAVRFLSIEPMLGPVDLTDWLWFTGPSTAGPFSDKFGKVRVRGGGYGGAAITSVRSHDLHWVITGGESGPEHRPFDPAWAADIRDQCVAAGVAYFHKQNGGRTPKAGGRELDGRTWDEFPVGASVGQDAVR